MNQYLVQVRATSSMKNDRTFTFHLILWQTRKQFPCVIMTKTFRVDRFQGTTGWPEVFVGCIFDGSTRHADTPNQFFSVTSTVHF